MENILTLIKDNKKTVDDFRKWLFNKLNRNEQNFRNFVKYPNNLKIPFLIEYLEHKGVNILEATCYYDALSSNQASSFEELLAFTITMEFKRIEKGKVINYIPF